MTPMSKFIFLTLLFLVFGLPLVTMLICIIGFIYFSISALVFVFLLFYAPFAFIAELYSDAFGKY